MFQIIHSQIIDPRVELLPDSSQADSEAASKSAVAAETLLHCNEVLTKAPATVSRGGRDTAALQILQ